MAENNQQFESMVRSREAELQEHAQEERMTRVLEGLDERRMPATRTSDCPTKKEFAYELPDTPPPRPIRKE